MSERNSTRLVYCLCYSSEMSVLALFSAECSRTLQTAFRIPLSRFVLEIKGEPWSKSMKYRKIHFYDANTPSFFQLPIHMKPTLTLRTGSSEGTVNSHTTPTLCERKKNQRIEVHFSRGRDSPARWPITNFIRNGSTDATGRLLPFS